MSELMHAAVLHGPGDLRVEEVPVPTLGADDALVAVAGVGLCGSDLHYYQHGRNGTNVVDRPVILGHEVAGTVVTAGEAVPHKLRGQRVVIEPARWCGDCQMCRHGRYNLCPHGWCLGSPPTPGGLASYVAAPARLVHPVPASLEPSVLPLLEPLAVAVHAMRRADLSPGHSVLVTGAGPVGLLVAQAAKLSGAGEVTVADVNPARLATAHRYGADHALQPQDVTWPVDRVLECSGAAAALGGALGAVRPGGRVVLVGTVPDKDFAGPLSVVQRYEVDLVGSFRYADAFPTAIAWAAAGRVDLAGLVTDTFPLSRAVDAFTHAASGAGLKTTLVCADPEAS